MIILTKLPWKLYPGYAIWSVIQVAPVMKTAQPRGPKCSQMWKLSSSSGQRGRRGRRKQSHLDLEVRQVNFLSWGSFPSSLWIDQKYDSSLSCAMVTVFKPHFRLQNILSVYALCKMSWDRKYKTKSARFQKKPKISKSWQLWSPSWAKQIIFCSRSFFEKYSQPTGIKPYISTVTNCKISKPVAYPISE